jgi:hypothetical protein
MESRHVVAYSQLPKSGRVKQLVSARVDHQALVTIPDAHGLAQIVGDPDPPSRRCWIDGSPVILAVSCYG